MRMLVRATFPVEASNAALKEGRLENTLQTMIERLKPEACYFFAQDGKRSGFFVFDMKDASDIPSIAEPLFVQLNASVEFLPVMNLDDLRAGLEKAAKNR
jgi:hypothetical protein